MIKRILVCALIFLLMSVPVDARANAQTYSTKAAFYQGVKDNLLAHKTEFTMKVSKKLMSSIGTDKELMDAVIRLDDKDSSKDADYLELSLNNWSESWRYTSISSTATITFQVEYETSTSQEKKLDDKLTAILTGLKLKDTNDYEKVRAIHDYIIKRVSYDQTLTKNSAYDALIGKSSVCEGYAAAAYRLFTDAGLESRIITGYAGGGPHSWNIVKVDGKWYNIDLTWDDPITNTGEQILRYDYFLKNAKAFSDHARDTQYNTTTYRKKYPIAKESYKLPKGN